MNLTELLAANPAAKAEYDSALAAARTEGEASGKAAMSATIDKVAPFLASKDYPATVATLAVKVLKGEESATALTTVVATLDAVREDAANKAAAAATAAAGETPGAQHQQVDPAATITDEAGLEAAIAAQKGGN